MAKSGKRHPIRVVARRTGTSETTLRAWERRYRAVAPERAETGRRLYSDQDIERLRLIRRAVDAGRSVSSVASLTDNDLRRLVEEDRKSMALTDHVMPVLASSADVVEACLSAVERMDSAALRSHLNRAMLKSPAVVLIDDVIAPLLHRIGEYWQEDRMRPRHEHMATSLVRTVLAQLQVGVQHGQAGTIVIGTPPGQIHDIGTLFVTALSVSEGWNAVNLGPDIPASDIATAAREVGAGLVALSLVHPPDDPRVGDALAYLSEHLHESTTLIAGGRAATSYLEAIERAGGTVYRSSHEFIQLLSKRGT